MSPQPFRPSTPSPAAPPSLPPLNLNAAGIDIGATSHFVALPPGRDTVSVREFATFTPDLHALAAWLKACAVDTVVMESTGVYWIPVFELLEQRGFTVLLADTRKVKNVSGRKSDVLDCQWLQQLHTFGLLQGAFRPADEIVVLRSYLCQRAMLIREAARHIQHMQKALQQMNLLLHHVVADITGLTGLRILRAILAGERDPQVLAQHRDPRCRASEEVIAKSLVGNYRPEHLFALKQAVALYDTYQAQLAECDQQIEAYLASLERVTEEAPPPSAKRRQAPKGHQPRFDARTHLYQVCGVDLTRIDGIEAGSALALLAEIGTDMTRWPSAKHFASWLGLCPGTKISGAGCCRARANPRRIGRRGSCAWRRRAYIIVRAR
jgi:transposase